MARRVTFVVASDFLSQNFGKSQGPTNDTFYECRLSGLESHPLGKQSQRLLRHSSPTCCNSICLKLLHSKAVGMKKHPFMLNLALAHTLVFRCCGDTKTLFLHAQPLGTVAGMVGRIEGGWFAPIYTLHTHSSPCVQRWWEY